MTTKDKLLEAQAHIKAKRYSEARALLRTIDHDTARQWLAKLDTIAPVKARGSQIVVTVLAVLVIGGMVLAIFLYFVDNAQHQFDSHLLLRMFRYCLDLEIETGGDTSGCMAWGNEVLAHSQDKVAACDQRAGELDTPFQECLIDEEILPPGVFRR